MPLVGHRAEMCGGTESTGEAESSDVSELFSFWELWKCQSLGVL